MKEKRHDDGGGRREVDHTIPDWVAYRRGVNRIFKLVMMVLIIAGIALVASLATYVNSRDDDRQSQETRAQIINILDEIQSCTTPDGECAERSRDNSQNISASIIYCTLNLPAEAVRDDVKQCILSELERIASD